MLGVLDQLRRWSQFHDAPAVHHRDPVGKVSRAREVMGDVQERQLVLLLQLAEQVEDLGAAGGVDHRYRLIRDEVVGLEDHGPGDADALSLPT